MSLAVLPTLHVLVTENALCLAGWKGFQGNYGAKPRLTLGRSESLLLTPGAPPTRTLESQVTLMRATQGEQLGVEEQGPPRLLLVCFCPVARLPLANRGARPAPGGGHLGRDADPYGLCVSHACHNAWLTLPSPVIEIHCQIY